MTPDGYLIGDRAVLADQGPMRFSAHRSDTAALQAASHIPAVQELSWFNRGYMRAQVRDGQLVLSDLRMGIDPNYSFNFAVAQQAGQQWQALDMPQRVRASGPHQRDQRDPVGDRERPPESGWDGAHGGLNGHFARHRAKGGAASWSVSNGGG